jgi:tryptophan-rich sensory protein
MRIAGAYPSLAARGVPAIVEFVWAAAVACIGVAAGRAVWTRAPASVTLSRAAIAAAALRELQRLVWTALPSDVIPGTRGLMSTAVVLACGVLLAASTRLQPR